MLHAMILANIAQVERARVLDDAAYGVGVWKGVVREQNFDALKPDLTSWPKNAN